MILINLCGGPGAGKTTMSYYLAYRLKKAGIRTELVGESAREDHIYAMPNGEIIAPALIDNQILLAGQQFERVQRLKRHGFEVGVSDSPMEQGMVFCEGHVYAEGLRKAVAKVAAEFETYNVFINPRPGSYDPESRLERTEAEARARDPKARKLMGKIWLEVNWDEEEKLGDAVVKLVLSKRPAKSLRRRARVKSAR